MAFLHRTTQTRPDVGTSVGGGKTHSELTNLWASRRFPGDSAVPHHLHSGGAGAGGGQIMSARYLRVCVRMCAFECVVVCACAARVCVHMGQYTSQLYCQVTNAHGMCSGTKHTHTCVVCRNVPY